MKNAHQKIVSQAEAIALLLKGGIGIMPTDTVYGLVTRAADEAACNRLYKAKHRENKPGTIIAASIKQLVDLGIKARYLKAVEQFWPGAVSVRIPHKQNYLVDPPTGTIAVRIPDDAELLAFLEQTGPLQTTSANMPGEPVATKLADAEAYFGDTIDFYVEGGDLSGRPPSTIIQIVDDAIEIVREGAVAISETGHIDKPKCPFCRSNGLMEPSRVIAATDEAYVIEHNSQVGKYLIIPNGHYERLEELSDDWWGNVRQLLPKLPPLGNYNLSINLGKHAGQRMGHLHFWVIPRASDQPSSGKGMAALINEIDSRTNEPA